VRLALAFSPQLCRSDVVLALAHKAGAVLVSHRRSRSHSSRSDTSRSNNAFVFIRTSVKGRPARLAAKALHLEAQVVGRAGSTCGEPAWCLDARKSLAHVLQGGHQPVLHLR
jgi:hypothetical protein